MRAIGSAFGSGVGAAWPQKIGIDGGMSKGGPPALAPLPKADSTAVRARATAIPGESRGARPPLAWAEALRRLLATPTAHRRGAPPIVGGADAGVGRPL